MATTAPSTPSDAALIEASGVPERTVPGTFLRQAAHRGEAPMVHHCVAGEWLPVSWSRTRDLALRVAAGLIAAGVNPGDHVMLISDNRLEWIYTEMGIEVAGAVSVPIYPSSTPAVVRAIAANCEAVLAVAGSEDLAAKFEITGPLREVVRMDQGLEVWISAEPSTAALAEIQARLERLDPEAPATIIYTSGTTGEPKGVVLAHRSLVDMARVSRDVFDVTESDVTLSFLPYSHVFERVSTLGVGLSTGGVAYLSRGIEHLVEDLGVARPTVMAGVPRMYEKMHAQVMAGVRAASPAKRALFHWALSVGARHSEAGNPGPILRAQHRLADRLVLRPLRDRLTGGRLRFFSSGGAPLSGDVERFFWALGVRILQGWGMTETSSGATSNTIASHRLGTVGRPFPGVELKIADDGEILVKSPGNLLRYHRNPNATAEVLVDGWLHTGDVGEIDADGHLRITDRKKDLIKTAGGKYVAPQPIEATLQNDPIIERAVVLGDNRPYCVALLVPDFAALASIERLSGDPQTLVTDPGVQERYQRRIDTLNRDLGSWEQIKYFTLLPEDFSEAAGELTPTLKVKRRAITERHAGPIEEMYRNRQRPDAKAQH